MKKQILILALMLSLTVILSGCAEKEPSEAVESSSVEESDMIEESDIAEELTGEKTNILFIEAEDPLHYDFGAFKVGDQFTTYEKTEEKGETGVTVRVHQSDIDVPYIAYFTCADEMNELEVDSSDCKLDDNGCFTQPGEFTVKLEYKGFEASYHIRVEEKEEEG